jgi:hypothetical protein
MFHTATLRPRLARWAIPRWAIRWWRSRARPLPFAVALALVLADRPWTASLGSAPSSAAALADVLSARGLACRSDDVTWLSEPRSVASALVGGARALVRASLAGEPSDLYLVEARLSPEGVLLAVGDTWNVTDTSGVDESRPIVRDGTAVYTTSTEGLMTGVHVLDLAGAETDDRAGFSTLQRAQVALANLQQTGQTSGVTHTAFAFDPIARDGSMEWRADGIVAARADGHDVEIDPTHKTVVAGAAFVRVLPDEHARPGNFVTWAVDRVRALSWFGDDRMQWLKAVAFTALDTVRSSWSTRTTSDDIRGELGMPAARASHPAFTDPDTGWPPAPIAVPVSPPLPGEGQWIALDRDPFITPSESGGPPPFVTSFLRPDVHRQDVRVYVTLWDPRQIALHIEAGTVEPISANGEHGSGLIARTPEVLSHVVAAFNGGFQAQHGEYGMQADGIQYLPPKPYAATVAELRDGSTAFGAWPDSAAVPDDAIAFRQNLTALVQGGKFNPWGRTWWGGTPPGWPDQIHATRSAICLTSDGFVGYFYSTSISADDLGQAMLAARCSFGIHLDMNPGHAGFEFYDVAPADRWVPLPRRLQGDWEAEGVVPDMAGYRFRARRMIRGMGHMLFPRYIQREARDFFYLTARPILPGAPIAATATDPGDGGWRTQGLPQHGFPYAVATTSVLADPQRPDVRLRVLRADPRTMTPSDRAPVERPTVLSLWGPPHGTLTLWWSPGAFAIAAVRPANDATPLVGGEPLGGLRASSARVAAGVQDEDGTLDWVELAAGTTADASTASAMDALLERLGCTARIALLGDARALLGGDLDLGGNEVPQPPPAVARLVRTQAPDAHPIFLDTPIVPVQVWQPLQAKRVRYFYKPPPSPPPTQQLARDPDRR